jgi:integrase
LALAGRAQTTPDDVVATRSGHVLLITGTMAKWCKQAGIPVANKREGKHGYTLHGLRKNFGIKLAEDGATGPQNMNAMGHSSLNEADPVSGGSQSQEDGSLSFCQQRTP